MALGLTDHGKYMYMGKDQLARWPWQIYIFKPQLANLSRFLTFHSNYGKLICLTSNRKFKIKTWRPRPFTTLHISTWLNSQRSNQQALFAMTTMATRIRDDIIRTGATSMSGKTRPVIGTWQSSAKGEPATCQLSSISSKLQNLDYKLQITNHKIQN